MNTKKAELITYICKACQEQELSLKDLQEVLFAVNSFYFQNARP